MFLLFFHEIRHKKEPQFAGCGFHSVMPDLRTVNHDSLAIEASVQYKVHTHKYSIHYILLKTKIENFLNFGHISE